MLQRQAIEKGYHDRESRKRATNWFIRTAYGANVLATADQYAVEQLGAIQGRSGLEVGCGRGGNALKLASLGAQVYATDISFRTVQAARRVSLAQNRIPRPIFQQMAGEAIAYRDGAFDFVFGHSVLHHLESRLAARELCRVLRPQGRAVFVEPLARHPLMMLFRKVTPHLRSPAEQPLRLSDLEIWAEPFAQVHHREFYLFSVLSPILGALGPGLGGWLQRLDDRLIQAHPALRAFCWVTVITLVRA
ncbi:MAG TPA: class I SAM-dependent methyltransferase [Anaerolineae bacterium]|nr:class I SAM-dependent methyltransferase [Anaerolineae bacterium]